MKISLCLPYMDAHLDRATMLDWMRTADQGPFHSLSCGERISGPTLEMRAVLAAAAAVTERVRIVPSLYVLPMHNAVWAAKEIATLDVLSGGRVTVCVGVGGREQDYRAVGADFSNRFQRMDEQVAVMRETWAGTPPFSGGVSVGPTPVQAGGPPILAGSMGPKSIQRVSRWADGVYSAAMSGDATVVQYFFDTAKTAWEQSGRDSQPYKATGFWYSLADNAAERLWQYAYDYMVIAGDEAARAMADSMTIASTDALLEALDRIEETGCDELFLNPATADRSELERLMAALDRRQR